MLDQQGHVASDADLDRFFRPRSVAVIGASDTEGRPNTGLWRRLAAWAGEVGAEAHPVNPGREQVDGYECYPSLADVPGDIDLVAVLISDVEAAIGQCLDRGVPFAVVFAAGFAELGADGEAAQARLAELINGGSLRVLGPNTNLNAFESFRDDLDGRAIALVTQSGHQGRPVFQSQELGIRVSHWAPTGNEVDLEAADFVTWFADQPDTGAIAAYIEGFKDGDRFVRAADHAARQGVPVVCVKVGRTPAGSVVAASHTGKLTGADAVTDAVFRQYGVTRVDGLDELVDTAALMARYPDGPPRRPDGSASDGVVVYAISGGTGAHVGDLCAAAGLDVPALSEDLQETLHQWIPDYLRVANPVDNGGHPVGDERGRKILDALLADPDVGVLVCPITGAFPPMSDRLAQDLVDAAETSDKPICVIWGSPVGTEPAYREVLLGSNRLMVFRTVGSCIRAIRAWRDWHRFRSVYRSPLAPEALVPAAVTSRQDTSSQPDLSGPAPLSEHASKELLAAYGIPVTRDRLVRSADEAVAAADDLGSGGPVVLKVSSGELVHKTEAGGVRLGIVGESAVRSTYAELAALGDGEVLCCEQVEGGVEAIVGVSRDAVFGPVVAVGLGGVLTEVLGDVSLGVPPFGEAEAYRMVRTLRGHRLLEGHRGQPPADEEALVDVLLRVQQLVLDLGDQLGELDINPLLVRPAGSGVVALDALVVPRAETSPSGNADTATLS